MAFKSIHKGQQIDDAISAVIAKESIWDKKQDQLSGNFGQVVGFDENGTPVAQDAPETGVISFNGRSGTIEPSAGDYTAEMVGADATGSAEKAYSDAKDYVDDKIASIPTPDVSGQINEHNTAADAHSDIRESIPTKLSELDNDSGYMTSYTETDPTVPSWAKSIMKPRYTASEVGALPASTVIPSKTSELTNDSNFITGDDVDIRLADLIDSAPETLNTLDELAQALGDDPNFATTVANQIGTKASSEDLNKHVSDTDNPHNVTAEQVGAIPTQTGVEGQVLGFIGENTVGAMDLPNGLPEGTEGQIIQYDADGNGLAVDPNFLPLAGGEMSGHITNNSGNWIIGSYNSVSSEYSPYTGLRVCSYGGKYVANHSEFAALMCDGSVNLTCCNDYNEMAKPLYMGNKDIDAIDANTRAIKLLKTPIEDYDAANKKYVDAAIAAAITSAMEASY